jgi:thiol-disulfide isomerase/thioredoxin
MSVSSIFAALLLLITCSTTIAQEVELIKKDRLDALLSPSDENDTTYVINFWATWCKPCVQEMPYFEKLNRESENSKVKVVLVSLDFKKNLDTHLKSFIRKNNIQSEVVLLDEPDYNNWINDVSSDWSGAIPATIFINGSKGKRTFHEKEFNYEELISELAKLK